MGARGPAPKPPEQRRRQNADAVPWRALPEEGSGREAPELPELEGGWHPLTARAWVELWSSPMAIEFLPADMPALVRWARLVERVNRGESLSAGHLSAIVQLEDRFGLTPGSRARLHWRVTAGRGRDDEAQSEKPKLASVSRLRAVDPGGS